MSSTSRYRYDLDGLRGIAIAFVVIFHVFVGKVSGGVDVFLLLSGYFFLGSQLRNAYRKEASLNPWWPLWRTIRRLYPALVVVLVATLVLISAFTPGLRQMTIAYQFIASLGYFQNWELIKQGQAYNAASDAVSPLQHLWSMAVQGQFYIFAILFACLVGLIVRRRRADARIVAGLPLLVVTSLSMFIAFTATDWQHNYYSTFSRMWELTLGAVLLLFCSNWRISPKAGKAMVATGLIMVLSTGLLFDGARQFPGPAALYPIGGAALIIIGGNGQGVLASAFMRWLGRIAYPLYLWHWPLLIVVMNISHDPTPPLWMGLAIIAVSVLLAQATHLWIEQPLRQHAARPKRGELRVRKALRTLKTPTGALRATAIPVMLATCIAAAFVPRAWLAEVEELYTVRLDPAVYPGVGELEGKAVPDAEWAPDPYTLTRRVGPAWAHWCVALESADPSYVPYDERPEDCTFGDTRSKVTAYAIGGSHTDQWTQVLDALGKEHGFKVVAILRQGCPATLDEEGLVNEDCERFNEQLVQRLEEDQPDFVITTTTRPTWQPGEPMEGVPDGYVRFWRELDALGIPMVGFRDNPWLRDPDGTPRMGALCAADTGDAEACGTPRADFYREEDPALDVLVNPEEQISIDTAELICDEEVCPAVLGNIYVYRDDNHLTNAIAMSAKQQVWEQMRDLVESIKNKKLK